jgi:hypothetical protein
VLLIQKESKMIGERSERPDYQSCGGDPAKFRAWEEDRAAQRLWKTGQLPRNYLHPDSAQAKSIFPSFSQVFAVSVTMGFVGALIVYFMMK